MVDFKTEFPRGAGARARDDVSDRLAWAGLAIGPAVFALMRVIPAPEGLSASGWSVAGIALLMAIWWLTQAIPLAATALLPAILFPVLGIGSIDEATAPYAHPLIFLFLGGFIVALTIQRWNLHRRIAIAVIYYAGAGPQRLVGGFMIAAAGLSMWISNTAAALMMLPIAVSVIGLVDGQETAAIGRPDARQRFARGLLIAIAYAASIGGIATLIGTPPNAFLAAYMGQAHNFHIGFGAWMLIGLPVSLILLAIAWLLICRVLFRADGLAFDQVRAGLAEERQRLGRASRGERMAAALFAALALGWMFQPFLARFLPVTDTGIALVAALAAFVLPVSIRDRVFLIDWKSAVKLPWEVLLLFGGGLSLARGIDETGLADWLGDLFADAGVLPVFLLVLLVAGLVIFLTELTSNTATAAVFIPVAATLAGQVGVDPMMLALPVALAASCAFMMPVATPPNAVVFSAGRLTVANMCYGGFLLNIAASVVIALAAVHWLPVVLPMLG